MANQIKRRNVSSLTYENFPGDERMGKAKLLQALHEAARASGETAPPKKAKKKRKAPSSAEEEVHRERRKKGASSSRTHHEETQEKSRAKTPPTATSEETPEPTPVITIPKASSSRRRSERPSPFDPSKDSLVSPMEVMATRYICNMAPDSDVPILMKADDAEVIAHFSAHIAPALVWGGERVRRLTQSLQKSRTTHKNFDKARGHHAEAVFRANGYPEEEHPASFLDVQQALAAMGDEEEAEEEEEQSSSFSHLILELRNWALLLGWGCHPKVPVQNWAFVPSWSGLCVCVEELRNAQVGLPPEEVPMRKWAYLPSSSGLCVCVEELREIASAELGFVARVGLPPQEVPGLGLGAELVGLMCLRRRAT
ncbi:hypothetical protein F511_35913 [Dorcoceras hygrometricum]|uniref:Uncharacterized protein n=1 Tax=Dorcoceras hygrometricum TaxID=472368 RepID=A0A2Z7CCW6_9LAMI|nr:hypothetical protein F511_35913 [Dorcoceras hygrometricum]